VGDVVASAPIAGAPHGALFKVAATSRTSEGLIVTTEPATVSELLGDATVKATVPTSDLSISVKPLDPGVTGGPATSSAGTDPGAEPAAGAGASTTATTTASPTAGPTAGSGAGTGRPGRQPTGTPARGPSVSPASGGSGSAQGRVAGPVPARARTAAATPSGRLSTQPSDGLLLRLDVPVSAPGISATRQGGPKLSGWVRIAPELIFSYQRERSRTQPGTAAIGVGGKYEYGWQLHAKIDRRADTGKKPLRVPFAEVHLNTVVWVGPLPVVIDDDLTYFYRISAEGRLSIDNEQRTRGEFAFGARYDTRAGWSPMRDHKVTTTVGKRNEIRGSGTATTALGARLAVYLYGTVGLTGELAPFLRTAVRATPLTLRWDLYAGFDLDGALSLRLQIFGIPILEQHLAFPTVHQEWRIAGSPA